MINMVNLLGHANHHSNFVGFELSNGLDGPVMDWGGYF